MLEDQIATFSDMAETAKGAGYTADAIRAAAHAAKARAALENLRAVRKAESIVDPLERVRFQRTRAEQAGQWGAAASLGAHERAIAKERAEQEAAALDEARAGMTEEQVLEELAAAAMTLPASLRGRLRALLAEH